jgi:hypothetical protein
MGALALAGCEQTTEPEFENKHFVPVGHWSFGSDAYDIEKTSLTYASSWSESVYDGITYPAGGHTFSGDIIEAIDFSETSGALIIKITGTPTYDAMSTILLTAGKYTAVYYKEYTSSHVFLANPVDSDNNPIEVNTLDLALNTFTPGKWGDHVSYWGSGYNKQ